MTGAKSRDGSVARGASGSAALSLLCASQFMVVLDVSIVNVALPSMQRDLAISAPALQGVITAYALTFGGLLLLGGRAADLYGRRRLFIGSLAAFSLASLAGGLSQDSLQLIAARAVQGVAAAIVAPTVLSLLTTSFAEGPARNRALGVYGAVAASGFAAGVLLGGVLTQLLNWRGVMFVNVPIGLTVASLAPRLLGESAGARRRLDAVGAVLATVGMSALVFALSQATEAGWTSLQTLGLLSLAVALLGGFVLRESRVDDPLIRLGIFTERTLTAANALALVQGASLAPTLYVITLYLQNVLHYSPITTGLSFLPQALIVAGAAQLVARLTDRVGVRAGLIAGNVCLVVGLLVLTQITAQGNPWTSVQPGLLLTGAGVAFLIVNISVAATSNVDDDEQGLASGLYNTGQQIGTALGLAVVVAVISATATPDTAGQIGAFRNALLTSVAFAVAGLAVSIFVVPRPVESARPTRGATEPRERHEALGETS